MEIFIHLKNLWLILTDGFILLKILSADVIRFHSGHNQGNKEQKSLIIFKLPKHLNPKLMIMFSWRCFISDFLVPSNNLFTSKIKIQFWTPFWSCNLFNNLLDFLSTFPFKLLIYVCIWYFRKNVNLSYLAYTWNIFESLTI